MVMVEIPNKLNSVLWDCKTVSGDANLFFRLINARYERGAMILTSNRGFGEWVEIFGDPVVASALLDRLLHHAIVTAIEGNSLSVA